MPPAASDGQRDGMSLTRRATLDGLVRTQTAIPVRRVRCGAWDSRPAPHASRRPSRLRVIRRPEHLGGHHDRRREQDDVLEHVLTLEGGRTERTREQAADHVKRPNVVTVMSSAGLIPVKTRRAPKARTTAPPWRGAAWVAVANASSRCPTLKITEQCVARHEENPHSIRYGWSRGPATKRGQRPRPSRARRMIAGTHRQLR